MWKVFIFVLLAVPLPPPPAGNTCTLTGGSYATLAASSGHWTGGCVTVPGSGDSAILSGTSLTIDVGETWTVGSSPANHGTPAISCVSGSDTSVLTNNGTIIAQGPITGCNSIWNFNAGSTYKCDASGAVSPTTALYGFEVSEGNNQSSANLVLAGNSGAHVTWSSTNSANPCGPLGADSINWGGSGRVQGTYVDFSFVGTASVPAWQFLASSSPAGQRYTCDHCTWDNTGALASDSWDGTEIFSLTHYKITNPLASPIFQFITGGGSMTTGSRTLASGYVKGYPQLQFTGNTGSNGGFLTVNNVLQAQMSGLGLSVPKLSGNYISYQVDSVIGHSLVSGLETAWNYVRMAAATVHHMDLSEESMCSGGCDMNIFGNVYGWQSSTTSNEDGSAHIMGGPAAGHINFHNNMSLPTAIGMTTNGGLFNSLTGSAPSWTADVYNNTFPAFNPGTSSYGIGGEGNVGSAGQFTSLTRNIAWNDVPHEGSWIHPVQNGTVMQAAGTWGCPDGNLGWNIQKYTGTGGPYSVIGYDTSDASMSCTPGTRDLVNVVNPTFLDSTRSAETAFHDWLGMNPSRGAWSSTNAYAAGDTVSDVMPSGVTTYWRATATVPASTANSEPLVGTAWLSYWEPAVDDVMGASVLADGPITPQALVQWVRAGFTPTNKAACGYGAVQCPPTLMLIGSRRPGRIAAR